MGQKCCFKYSANRYNIKDTLNLALKVAIACYHQPKALPVIKREAIASQIVEPRFVDFANQTCKMLRMST